MIYQCFLAIAAKHGYESSNQSCTIALMRYLNEQELIQLPDRFIELLEYEQHSDPSNPSIIEMREDYTYGILTSVAHDQKIQEISELCKELIDITKEIIFANTPVSK